MKEDFLHYLWKYKKIPQNMCLTSGDFLFIRSFGEYNPFSGADFFNAHLQIGEQLWVGNVEMHLRSSYWYAHKHEQDPNYANVILHVVWEHDVEVFDKNQQALPTLELKNQIEEHLFDDYVKLLRSESSFINCEKDFAKVDKTVFSSWKEHLIIERLEQKSDFVKNIFEQSGFDWEKLLFLMLLKDFGGSVNGAAFLELGKNIDFSVIRKEKYNPLHIEAIFFGLIGFLSVYNEEKYVKKMSEMYQYLQRKYELRGISSKIEFSGLRPQGFPTIRLSQLAQLYEKTDSLFSKVIEIRSFSECKNFFSVATSEFWETHYTFGKSSTKIKKKVTQSLIERIFINTIIPIKYLYFKLLGKDISEEVIAYLRDISSEKNQIITRYESLGTKIDSAFDTQMLLQQYKNYCQKQRCLDCAIGINLLKGK